MQRAGISVFCTNRPIAKFHKIVTDTVFLADFRTSKSMRAVAGRFATLVVRLTHWLVERTCLHSDDGGLVEFKLGYKIHASKLHERC